MQKGQAISSRPAVADNRICNIPFNGPSKDVNGIRPSTSSKASEQAPSQVTPDSGGTGRFTRKGSPGGVPRNEGDSQDSEDESNASDVEFPSLAFVGIEGFQHDRVEPPYVEARFDGDEDYHDGDSTSATRRSNGKSRTGGASSSDIDAQEIEDSTLASQIVLSKGPGETNTFRIVDKKHKLEMLVGIWKKSTEAHEKDKHAVYGFLGSGDCLIYRVYNETVLGSELSSDQPLPLCQRVQRLAVLFLPHLRQMDDEAFKRYLKNKLSVEETLMDDTYQLRSLGKRKRKSTVTDDDSDFDTDTGQSPKRRLTSRKRQPNKYYVGDDPSVAQTPGLKTSMALSRDSPDFSGEQKSWKKRKTTVLIGYWKDSDASDPVDKHGIWGIIKAMGSGQLRLMLKQQTRDGREYVGNFPHHGTWKSFDDVVLEDHLAGMTRIEVQEYVKIRIRDIEAGGPGGEYQHASELRAVSEAKQIIMRHGKYTKQQPPQTKSTKSPGDKVISRKSDVGVVSTSRLDPVKHKSEARMGDGDGALPTPDVVAASTTGLSRSSREAKLSSGLGARRGMKTQQNQSHLNAQLSLDMEQERKRLRALDLERAAKTVRELARQEDEQTALNASAQSRASSTSKGLADMSLFQSKSVPSPSTSTTRVHSDSAIASGVRDLKSKFHGLIEASKRKSLAAKQAEREGKQITTDINHERSIDAKALEELGEDGDIDRNYLSSSAISSEASSSPYEPPTRLSKIVKLTMPQAQALVNPISSILPEIFELDGEVFKRRETMPYQGELVSEDQKVIYIDGQPMWTFRILVPVSKQYKRYGDRLYEVQERGDMVEESEILYEIEGQYHRLTKKLRKIVAI